MTRQMNRRERMIRMAQDGLSNATIANRLGAKAHTVRITLSKARGDGFDIPFNQDRVAREIVRTGTRLPPLGEAEIEALEAAARARMITATDLVAMVVRELVADPTLIDNILDDGVRTDG